MVTLAFEDRVVAILKLLCDHAGIGDSAVERHLEEWQKRLEVSLETELQAEAIQPAIEAQGEAQ